MKDINTVAGMNSAAIVVHIHRLEGYDVGNEGSVSQSFSHIIPVVGLLERY